MDNYRDYTPDTATIKSFYTEAIAYFAPERPQPAIHISFYPYIGINHTIRIRSGEIFVRISEICRDMPNDAHRGLAYILTGKLLKKRIPKRMRDIYTEYSRSDELRELAEASKKIRGRKVITTSKGSVYDLEDIFSKLNTQYFSGNVDKPSLSWSAKKTFRILGHHDRTHGHISISRSLDDVNVPPYVVKYVMFHEMLHIVHPSRIINGRRYNHTSEFRRDEHQYPDYERANTWIEANVAKLRRRSGQQ